MQDTVSVLAQKQVTYTAVVSCGLDVIGKWKFSHLQNFPVCPAIYPKPALQQSFVKEHPKARMTGMWMGSPSTAPVSALF